MNEKWRTTAESTSSALDGNRHVWDFIWKSDVPPKVQHFAWRLATDSLPSWLNKHKRTLETSGQCPVCAVETEDNFHPFFRCPLAKQFWNFMAEKWPLLEIKLIQNTGKDWLLTLLGNLPKESICKTLMTLWRIWHIRNEIVHDKRPPPMEASRQFLMCYMDSLLQIKYHSSEDIIKGKFVLNTEVVNLHRHAEHAMPTLHWTAPPPGWCKLNTDGSLGADGNAGAGMLVRDYKGDIIASACRQLYNCRDALESELCAAKEGLALALNCCTQPIIFETDCLEIIKLLQNNHMDRSVNATIVEDVKTLLKDRHTCITHVKRAQNISSHFLANFARMNGRTEVWLASGPEGLADTCKDIVIPDVF
jgi:ribonuclease HI